MARIEKRQRSRRDGTLGSTRWRARVETPDGERSKTFVTQGEAKKWAATEEANLARGSWIDPRAGRQTFGDYAREWRAVQVHRPGTKDKVDSAFDNHILPWFENRPIASIRKSTVQGWVKDREKEMAPSTLEVVYSFVASVLKAAADDKVIAQTPCQGIKLPKKPKNEVIPPAVDEVEAIVGKLPRRYRTIAIVAAGAGLRSGELLGLTVGNIDFLRRTIRVEQQLRLPNRGPLYIGPPKTEASYRTIPVPDVVIEALAAHLAEFPAIDVELGDTTAGVEVPRRHELVFSNTLGRPIRRNALHDTWKAAVASATVEREGPGGKKASVPVNQSIGLHDFRHFYASLLIQHRESVKVVQARLGHASAVETLDTYGHLWEGTEEATREAVQGVLGGVVAALSPAVAV